MNQTGGKSMQHLRSYQLAVQFYREAKGISVAHYVKDQLRRAALSVALNLSEGTGKSSMPDRRRFFEIAMGSIRECQAITEIEADAFTSTQKDLLDHLAASTYKLIKNSSP
jgi:four helix bundle protein